MILSLFLPSLNVSNYHIADSIMKKLFNLNQCHNRRYLCYLPDDMKPVYVISCMIQEIGLSCPFPTGHCTFCQYNPIFWFDGIKSDSSSVFNSVKDVIIKAHNFER